MRALVQFIIVILLLCGASVFTWRQLPCAVPLQVHIGIIDPQFKVTQKELESAIIEAGALWEGVVHRKLYAFTVSHGVPINFVYDRRQSTQEELAKLDSEIEKGKEQRMKIVSEHDQLMTEHGKLLQQIQTRVTKLQNRQDAYEKKVNALNENGGASDQVVTIMNAERDAIRQEAENIRDLQSQAALLADKINATIRAERALVPTINSAVSSYNNVVDTYGEEFEDGLYSRTASGTQIQLFVYETHPQLVRLLTHEMGHAIGLGHIADPTAVMNAVNISQKPVLSEGDKALVVKRCRVTDIPYWRDLARRYFLRFASGNFSME